MQSELDSVVPQQLADACVELERRLRHDERCSASDLLRRFPILAAHPTAALELIYTEYVVRKELGQDPNPQTWIEQFPQWRDDLCELFQVHDLLGDQLTSESEVHSDTVRDSGGSNLGDMRGRRIGQYEILDEIARGGMGVVYRAMQVSLSRVVALKMIQSPVAGPRECARLRTEADATARLQHPNIVPVYEVGEHGACPYMAMEFIDGVGLDKKLADSPLAARPAAELLESLARAVQFAHDAGIIHRDLKPANVLLNRNGVPKITDFGLAKRVVPSDSSVAQQSVNGLTQAGVILGTPSYMAPEQASSGTNEIGPSADVYSLGSILYECLTGRAPFRGETALHTLELVRGQDPAPPHQLQPNVPRDLETICLKCLEKAPRKRYAAASDLAADLRRFLDGKPIQARAASQPERMVKWVRRRPAAAGLIAAVVLGFFGMSWQWLRAESQRASAESSRTQAVQAATRAEQARRAESDQRDQLERLLYFHDIALAHHEYLANNSERAQQLLDACPPELRHWEWHYLNRLCRQEVLTLTHNQRVLDIAFSPDGSRLAACTGVWHSSKPGELKVWDSATGKEVWTLTGHSSPVMSLAFSPDGKLLASAAVSWGTGVKEPIKIWDMSSGIERRSITHHEIAFSVAFSPAGYLAAGYTNGVIRIWDVSTAEVILSLEGHEDTVFGLSFSLDGRRLASGSRDGTVRLWDTADGREIASARALGDTRSVAFSPDGNRLAAGTFNGRLYIYDVRNNQLREVARHARTIGVESVCFSPDGRSVALATRGEGIKIWDVVSGEELRVFRGHTGYANDVAFSPDGRRLASGGLGGLVKIWDLAYEPQLAEFGGTRSGVRVSGISFSPDGKQLAIGHEFKAGSRSRVTDGTMLRIRDNERGRFTTYQGHTDSLTCVAFSPTGATVASASKDKTARIWDVARGNTVHILRGHTSEVSSVVFSPDGSRLATASADSTVKVWDSSTGRETHTLRGHESNVHAVLYRPGGRYLISTGSDRSVRVWDTDKGEQVSVWPCSTPMTSLAISGAAGNLLAGAGEDGSVQLWDFEAPEGNRHLPVRTLRGHTERVASVAFSPDGKRLISAGLDCIVRIWDVATGHEAGNFVQPINEATVLSFSPDGKQIALGGSQVRVWDGGERLQVVPDQTSERAVGWHRRAMQKSERENDWFAAAFHAGQLTRLAPNDARHYATRGQARAELGDLHRAAEDFAKAGELSDNHIMWCRAARCYLAAGDVHCYQEVCRSLLEKYSNRPAAINAMTWIFALSPDSGIDPSRMVELAEQAVDARRDADTLNTLGAALVRAGRTSDSIAKLNEAMEAHPHGGTPYDWLLLALAYEKAGQITEARDWFNRASHWIDLQMQRLANGEPDPSFSWFRRIGLVTLHKEVQSILSRLPEPTPTRSVIKGR